MTEQLYLADDTVSTFEAIVERSLDDRVVLDRTQFYPTGGGQPHDTGTLRVAGSDDEPGSGTSEPRRWRVVDVEKSDTVYHTLASADGDDSTDPPTPETRVVGEIDWDRRRAHARYHTAQHLLSALLLREFDARTTGNQLYTDHAHLDAEHDRFDDDDLELIERRLNALVAEARPVESYTMDREEAESTLDTDRTRIELLPDSITELRIVEIGGSGDETVDPENVEPYDRTACAGTHVGNTSEIGEIVVTGRETKGSREERVNFTLAEHVDAEPSEADHGSI